MSRSRSLALVSALATLLLVAGPAHATWPHDPSLGNVPVCTATGGQFTPTSVSDGAGGAIVVWQDYRSGTNYDVYAQRISAAGVPLWTTNGVALCTATGDQALPMIATDGAGGAIVTWADVRGASYDIYAQRVSAAGVPQWTANGVAVCSATSDQVSPVIVADGLGGAIVTWQDLRSGLNYDIYAQRVNGAGTALWTANGVAVCTATGAQFAPTITTDGASGAIVSWYDLRSASTYDIYAQRVNAAGTPQWPANGVGLCTTTGDQTLPTIAPDGAGGAIVAWVDTRSGGNDVYAQRVSAIGGPLWTTNGVAVCVATNQQFSPQVIADGTGGAIVTWQDYRSGTTYDIYAQRLTTAGIAVWATDGNVVCTAVGSQFSPMLVSDGAGGAIIGWYDYRLGGSGYSDVYAQRITASGATLWTSNGVAISTAVGDQQSPTLASDGQNGAILAFVDYRAGGGSTDIYAQRVERFGQLGDPEPAIAGVKDVPNDQGGTLKLSWTASYLDADPTYGVYDYMVWRSVPAASLTARALLARGATRDPAEAAASGRLLIHPFASQDYFWESVGTQLAGGLSGYSMAAATLEDSVGASNPRTAFMVEARSSTYLPSPHWFSAPDSGYSVDNLPPLAPAPFTGQYAAGTTRLHWDRNAEADLAGYRLYRGTSVAFVPGAGNLVSAQPDTGYADAAGAPYVYKLTAVDIHGNESPVATLVPSGTLGVGDEAAPMLSFAAPSPNPARGPVVLRFSLARAGHVRLALFDASGRRVRTLRDGDAEAGDHVESLTLVDDTGHTLAPGLYLARLEAEGHALTRRLAAIH